jgi:hypothetical protein
MITPRRRSGEVVARKNYDTIERLSQSDTGDSRLPADTEQVLDDSLVELFELVKENH